MIEKKELETKLDKLLDDIVDKVFENSQDNLNKNGTTDTSALAFSGKVYKDFLEKIILYTAPHAVPIEEGTGPHFVSRKGREKIEVWCRRKLGKTPKEAKSMSYAIITNISKRGQDAQPYLLPGLYEEGFF